MEFQEAVAARASVRRFANLPVAPDALERVLATANQAPSAGNLQAFEIYVVTDASVRRALAEASLHQGFVAEAPVVLVFCAHADRAIPRYGDRGRDLYCVQDATIACTYAMLAATDEQLASVWVGAFDDASVADAIDAPAYLQPVAVLPIGYAAEEPRPTQRRSLDDVVHRI